MSLPLWCLLCFVAWTVLLLVAVALWRVALVLSGRRASNAFPADEVHGEGAYRRLHRAHLNCTENLALFAVVVLVAELIGVESAWMGNLALVYLVARVLQSCVHVVSTSAPAVNLRFGAFATQVVALVGMLSEVARAAS